MAVKLDPEEIESCKETIRLVTNTKVAEELSQLHATLKATGENQDLENLIKVCGEVIQNYNDNFVTSMNNGLFVDFDRVLGINAAKVKGEVAQKVPVEDVTVKADNIGESSIEQRKRIR